MAARKTAKKAAPKKVKRTPLDAAKPAKTAAPKAAASKAVRSATTKRYARQEYNQFVQTLTFVFTVLSFVFLLMIFYKFM